MAASRVQENRPYQGYPYVNPVVIDVPSLDAATAAKWANLPRKPIDRLAPKDSRPSGPRESTQKKEDDTPVIYVPLPDDNGGSVTEERGEGNPAFVEETIFYDPFENRQIDMTRPKDPSDQEEASGPGPSRPAPSVPSSVPSPADPRPSRPGRPNNLHLYSPGSSHGSTSTGLPNFMSKESQVYGGGGLDDGFSLTPLPVAEYPAPPPYSEIDPPRTEVVVVPPDQGPTVGLPSSNRKLVSCQHCGMRVHTLVTRENGLFTHFLALITVLLCFFPLTAIIYCTNCFKYQVHYCPNCNYKVGHEIPLLCTDVVYTKP